MCHGEVHAGDRDRHGSSMEARTWSRGTGHQRTRSGVAGELGEAERMDRPWQSSIREISGTVEVSRSRNSGPCRRRRVGATPYLSALDWGCESELPAPRWRWRRGLLWLVHAGTALRLPSRAARPVKCSSSTARPLLRPRHEWRQHQTTSPAAASLPGPTGRLLRTAAACTRRPPSSAAPRVRRRIVNA